MDGDDTVIFLRLIKTLKWDLDDVESSNLVELCINASAVSGWSDDLKELVFEFVAK